MQNISITKICRLENKQQLSFKVELMINLETFQRTIIFYEIIKSATVTLKRRLPFIHYHF